MRIKGHYKIIKSLHSAWVGGLFQIAAVEYTLGGGSVVRR